MFPVDPPLAGGAPRGGPIAIFQRPRETWSTSQLRTVMAPAQACVDDGADSGLLLPVIEGAQAILERRRGA